MTLFLEGFSDLIIRRSVHVSTIWYSRRWRLARRWGRKTVRGIVGLGLSLLRPTSDGSIGRRNGCRYRGTVDRCAEINHHRRGDERCHKLSVHWTPHWNVGVTDATWLGKDRKCYRGLGALVTPVGWLPGATVDRPCNDPTTPKVDDSLLERDAFNDCGVF